MIMATSIVKRMTERLSKNIQTFPDPSQKEAIVTELLQAVVRTTSNVIDDTQMAGWSDLSHEEQMRVATALLIGLEENAFLLADNVFREKTIVQTVKNICKFFIDFFRILLTVSLFFNSIIRPCDSYARFRG